MISKIEMIGLLRRIIRARDESITVIQKTFAFGPLLPKFLECDSASSNIKEQS